MRSVWLTALRTGIANSEHAAACALQPGLFTELVCLRRFQAFAQPAWSTAAGRRHLHHNHSGGHGGARVLDGRAVAAAWQEELAAEAAEFRRQAGRPPGLGVIMVGGRPDSAIYVHRKQEACHKVGIRTDVRYMPATVSQASLEAAVAEMCANPKVDGLLVQLPLPPHIDEEAVIESFDPAKDVDGFHPLNMGRTLMRGRSTRYVPCTPLGCMQLLRRSGVQVRGRSVVVVGDSNIVGIPLAMLFRDDGAATVTVVHRTSYTDLFQDAEQAERAAQRASAGACLPPTPGPRGLSAHGAEPEAPVLGPPHPYQVSYSSGLQRPAGPPPPRLEAAHAPATPHIEGLPEMTRTADILVVAVGYPRLVKRSWVKPGAAVIDVGINVVGWAGEPGGKPGAGHGSGRAVHQDIEPPHEQHQAEHSGSGHSGAAARSGGKPGDGAHQHHHPLFHVVGDVDFADVSGVAAAISPVPGGVGPMTIAAVLHNTLAAAWQGLRAAQQRGTGP